MYSGFSDVAKQAMLQQQESMLEVKSKKKQALYRYSKRGLRSRKNRIPLTPLSVALLVNNGHDIILESNAGQAANFSDKDYSDQGANIVYDSKSVYTEADIIIKIAPPTLHEIELMRPGQILISALQMSTLKADCLHALMHKKSYGAKL